MYIHDTRIQGCGGSRCTRPSRPRTPFSRSRGCALFPDRPGGNPRVNLESTSHRCFLREVAFEWEVTNKETIHLPLGCLQDGE